LLGLAGDSRFVGKDDGAAAALDLAWLSKLYGTFLGAAHGVLLCESEGVDLASYASLFSETDHARWLIDVIRTERFTNPGARLSVWNRALHRIIDSATDKGMNDEFPVFIAGILDRAEAEGLGDQHIAGFVKILRAAKPGS
jgi:3-hydroxyisobutyrate dehydrogenase-like beta-hydroxyacid dehydrogenase